jgi:UDPglucose 6-dehydrogenase
VKALIITAEENNYSLEVLKAVERVNNKQKSILFDKLYKYYKGQLKDKTIGIWGLSFKPKTDDMREAPSLVIIEKLLEHGATVKAYDPVAMEEARKILGDRIEYAKDQYDAVIDADAMILVTEWSEFRIPNFKVIKKLLNKPAIFDGRNIYDPEEMEEYAFDYFSIGRNA